MLQAEEMGIKCAYGLSMLAAQAIKAAEYFFRTTYSADTLPRVLSGVAGRMRNITLIGMPGCGKSTVGRIIANRLGRDFLDSDAVITEKTGRSPAEWITEYGEGKFREIETEILREITKLSGKVIATGGGAVTVAENKALLRQNGSVFFINRNIELLSTEGRPLSGGIEIRRALYEKRLPLYLAFCDAEILSDADATAENTAEQIIASFLKISERG